MLASLEYAKPLQDETELDQLIALLQREGVRSYCEIGARYGGSLEAIMSALPVGSFGLAIDLPGGKWGDKGSAPILKAACERLKAKGRIAEAVFASSRSIEAYGRALEWAPFDALMIDGDHSYSGAHADWKDYSSLARIVILHDIAAPEGHKSRDGHVIEVPKLWRKLKKRGRYAAEIIQPDSQMGIGVIWR